MRYVHGMRHTPEYKAWAEMRYRCDNPKSNRYSTYGYRKITYCKEWESFKVFFKDLGKRPSSNHSLHRINNDLGYCKSNCKWATDLEQANAKTTNVYVMFNGSKYTISQLARKYKINYFCLRSRLKRGWEIVDAIKPVTKSLRQKAKDAGLNYHTVFCRIQRGWPEKKALSTPTR